MNQTSPSKKIERMMGAIRYLREHHHVTVDDLSHSLSSKPAEIIEDLQELSQAGIPVVLSKDGCHLLPAFESGTELFELDESFYLLQGLNVLLELGAVNDKSYTVLQTKLLSTLSPAQSQQIKQLAETPPPTSAVSHPVNPECMSFVHQAVIQHQRITLKYQSRTNSNPAWRDLSPYSILFRKNAWYVIGYCHRRREIRTFKLNRIFEYTRSNQAFYSDPEFDLQEYLLYTWNIIGGQPELVIIRFKGEARQLILEKTVRNGRVWKENGMVYMKVIVSGLDEIGWWVMQYGELAEVLQPDRLRQWMATRAIKMSNLYKDDLKSKHRGKKIINLF